MQLLSIVVTLTGGDNRVSACLEALLAQRDPPPCEILVPVYPALHDVSRLRGRWPSSRFANVQFIGMPDPPPPAAPALEHWKVDRLRAVGLAAARGDVIALIQDNAVPGEGWCAALWEQHRSRDYAAIGGGVRYARASTLNRAVFYCDFGRFEPPFPRAVTGYASVANVSYKRAAIQACRDSWQQFYDESVVHRRIAEAGGAIYLTPDFAVDVDRGPLTVAVALREKCGSGRVFAARRARFFSGFRRLAMAALSPGLAPLMLLRQFRMLHQRGHKMGPWIAAAPVSLLCLVAWSLGECMGYATAQPYPRPR